jgi:hypothetical protein
MPSLRHIKFRYVLAATLAAVCLASLVLAQAKKKVRKLGTCGPPPRSNPQRQTSSEGMPPLPLPATPLRRSEPKAEPAPPLMMAKLEYGTFQDWNTDPGDADNLMRQVRDKLNLWYGWKQMHINELVAKHKAGKQCPIPILYMSGHEPFQFNDAQRAAIKQYVQDGGTFLGDACCGREEFADSFRKEVLAMFPDRAFETLELDHPIFKAFYKYTSVNYIEYIDGKRRESKGPPKLEGVNIGCRTAVIFTPFDMSCGWDGHTHPRGKRVEVLDAQQLGINIISYVAATRQLGEVQAVTREIQAPTSRPREQFHFAQLRHQGDWNPDPNSVAQWMRHVALDSSLSVDFRPKIVDPVETKLAPYPFVYMTGHRDPGLSSREIAALRRHLKAGGFLFINNCCGRSVFDHHVRSLVGKLFPDQKLKRIKPDDELYKSFFKIAKVRDRQTRAVRALDLEGITIKGRLALVYSSNDMVTHLKQVSDPFGNGYDADSCRKLAVNIVAYAMQN